MKYAWIKDNRDLAPLLVMCRVLEVSSTGLYDWLKRQPSKRQKENELICEQLKQLFEHSRATYGTRRLKRALAKRGLKVSRRRIARLLKSLNLKVKTKKKYKPCTTDSKHNNPIAENLLDRQFQVDKANQCFVGDITYIETDEGWLYLAIWIDLYSRAVVGWSMDDNMRTELVCEALLMAIGNRDAKAGLMIHSDRGSQYSSKKFRQLLSNNDFIVSMSRRAQCWDNAVAESFFHTLKTENVFHKKYLTREAAKQDIFEYIEVFYNRQRMHSNNDYLSPVEFESLAMAS